jgi:hypothetical protein
VAAADERARLIAQTVDLFRARKLHWIHGAGETFVLSVGRGQILVRPEGDRWTAVFVTKATRTIIAERLPLDYAQGRAEDYARTITSAHALIDPSATWRTKPASPKQLAALRKFRIHPTGDLTAGAASDLISSAIAARCTV